MYTNRSVGLKIHTLGVVGLRGQARRPRVGPLCRLGSVGFGNNAISKNNSPIICDILTHLVEVQKSCRHWLEKKTVY